MPKPLFSKLVAQGAIGFFCILFGCVYSIRTSDRIFLILSLLVGTCCILRAIHLYRLIRSRSYRILEGTCTKREPTLLRNTQQVFLIGDDQQEYQFSLDKNIKLLKGHRYRLYFRTSPHEETGASPHQEFLGFEELSVTSSDKA